jgi:hypothetical protein
MANDKTPKTVIEPKAAPPPTTQTSLLLNFVELGSFAQCLALSFSKTPHMGC